MIVVMPMAGRGSRFSNKGFQIPKPLIMVAGVPMFIRALGSIGDMAYEKLVFVALKEHEEKYKISDYISYYLAGKPTHLMLIDDITEGQLCTVLLASEYFANKPVLIIASDTLVEGNIKRDISQMPNATGIISVINIPGESWSFAKTGPTGWVMEVQEKVRISDNASTGIYYFSSGSQLTEISHNILKNNERVRGEFFVIPVYQKLIDCGYEVRLSQAEAMWDMGTPESMERFLAHLNATK